jgi:hypothetical protein
MIKKLQDKITDIIDFLTYNPFGLRTLYERVIGTIEYATYVWKNHAYREWDYAYLYDLMQFKLERMALQLKKDTFVADSNERYEEILKALAYLHIYNHVEDEDYDHNNVDMIREMYKQQQDAWNGFHDTLKEHAQKWWS